MNRTRNACPKGMVDTCCENYDNCSIDHDKDAEIKRLNEKIEFLARANMLYSDWEHRSTQVTSDLIRKGIEAAKENVELRAEIERLKKREWVGLTDEELKPLCDENHIIYGAYTVDFIQAIEAKLKEKNT